MGKSKSRITSHPEPNANKTARTWPEETQLPMPSSSHLFCELASSLSLHRMVLQALDLEDDLEMLRLAEHLRESRKAVMTILCALLEYYASVGRFSSASWVVTIILLTFGTSSLYDGLDPAFLRDRIRSIHPITFTIINAIPNIATGFILIIEIVSHTQSVNVILMQALLVTLPLLYQVLRVLWNVNLDGT